jgi:predicted metalloprotease with PDZ domain
LKDRTVITYTISMLEPHSHLYDVQVEVDQLASPEVDLVLPSWTPGSYMVREYARHVQEFSAQDAGGRALAWRKVAKDTWRVGCDGAERIVVRYKVYAYELTVRTSHLDGSHGYFNGTTVFMYLPGRTNEPLALDVITPQGWHVSTGLNIREQRTKNKEQAASSQFSYLAQDYDELVDCPCECGTHRVLTFAVDEIPHYIALWGSGNEDEAQLVADTKRIVETQRDLFGGLPYEHYTFIVHLTDGRGGGLEHRNSVTNMLDRWTFKPERVYERYLSLTSHELFHVWNVKRIRPAPLGPFDYRGENYTRMLWAMEGVTSYYDELLLVRAGQMRPERYLEKLADEILTLQSQPGRHLQSLEQSSFDAWIKFYRPDENSTNTAISYYLKGALVSLILDMEIRKQTGGEASLDDVQRELFQRYPLSAPGIPEDGAYIAAIEAVAGVADGAFQRIYQRYIAGTEELDYDSAFAVVGLRLAWGQRQSQADGQAVPWLGIKWKRQGERTLVAEVRSDGPAYAAGIYAEDELVGLDGWRVNEEKLNARLLERAPGDTVTLSLFRGDALLAVPVTLAPAPPNALALVPMEGPTELQGRMYRAWLGQD